MQDVVLDVEAAVGGDANAAVAVLEAAARGNVEDPQREGGLLRWAGPGRVLMTGDLHDHALNYQRILKFARLDADTSHRLVLHEVVHGPGFINGMDLSIRMLLRTAGLRALRPGQVAILQSNHELAQRLDDPISKHGVAVVDAFSDGVSFLFGDGAEAVTQAMNAYIDSLPLGVVLDHGVMVAHSLPGPRSIERFDTDVIRRMPTEADLRGGSAYDMVWGRWHNAKVVRELVEAWRDLGVKRFVLGHQPAEMGWERVCPGVLVLASDHDHGAVLPLEPSRLVTDDTLDEAVVLLASVRMR